MRRSVIVATALQSLAAVAALLWLLWGFIPAGGMVRSLITLLILILPAGLAWKMSRRGERETAAAPELPLLDTQEPIVLVCGDGLGEIFQGRTLRKTAQGWWLRAGDVEQLTEVVRTVQRQFPSQVGQLSVMYLCQPDRHQDEAALRAVLKSLRLQSQQLNALSGFMLPVVVCCEFSGPPSPWIVVRGAMPLVYEDTLSPQALTDWQQTDNHIVALPVLSQASAFIRQTLLDELEKADRLTPAATVFAVALRLGAVAPQAASLWTNWLYRRSGLQFPSLVHPSAPFSHFPDALLPLLAPFVAPRQAGPHTRRLILLLCLCGLLALGFSAFNNSELIRRVGSELQRWAAIPVNHAAPKAQALAALKKDVLLLERWQRQGEPLRYSLGYYPGQRLWLALQQAIDSWLPPATAKPEPLLAAEPQPNLVRLDSLSLFASGSAALNNGSTRVLVTALMGIKARPGWLIVVSGHTDNTGSAQRNQTLSLQRAEAVRNWMRDTGGIPESCFAVQGYGNSRPIASDDTPDGRAHNRRVEISLVAQANACRLPDAKPASQDERDVLTDEKEK